MIEPSNEQKNIIESLVMGKNVVVNAVAGSGKSTTVLLIADAFTDKQILQLTYNSQLRIEMKERIERVGKKNLTVHTYHSLAVCFYSPQAHNDTELRRIIRNDTKTVKMDKKWDIIIIDEAQDMTPLYFHFVQKWIADHVKGTFQLVILGDEKQGLYEFKGSDIRFLTMADQLWCHHTHLHSPEFNIHTLKTSYRLTIPMAAFVNNVMLGEERLLACRDGVSVRYIRTDFREAQNTVKSLIQRLLREGNRPDDFFILCGSLKNSVRKWENLLVSENIPCYLPTLEMDGLDERVIRGKVVFSTFHSVKGRQRKFVFVVGFDDSYFDYFARDAPRTVCPNTLYVGCTRATDQLIVMEKNNHFDDKPLSFLKKNHSQMMREPYIDFQGTPKLISWTSSQKDTTVSSTSTKEMKHPVSPTDLIKFIPDETMEIISLQLENLFEDITVFKDELTIPIVIETKRGFHEDVSDINGTVIPFFYLSAAVESAKNSFYELVQLCVQKLSAYPFLKRAFNEFTYTGSISDHLFLSNLYSACNEKLFYRLQQIDASEYTWLTQDIIDVCIERLDSVLGDDDENLPEMEKTIIQPEMIAENDLIHQSLATDFPDKKFNFTARVDTITNECIWEWKCTTHITVEHFLQVIIYAWIWTTIHPEHHRDFKIYNIKTGEMFKLNGSLADWRSIVVTLLRLKYEKSEKYCDSLFIEKMRGSAQRVPV